MLVDAQDLWKSYTTREGRLDVLRGVSIAVEAGSTVALTGDSGSGKSTLLHLLAGLDAPDRGVVRIGGSDIASMREADRAAIRCRRIGLVFQHYNLIPALDTGANLAFQARLAGRHDAARTTDIAMRLGLGDLLARYPDELSGGQQQRVAIGRALAAAPDVVLADEPTGNLDETTGDAVIDLLLEGVEKQAAALVLVTHSPRVAARMQRRLHLRAGRLDGAG